MKDIKVAIVGAAGRGSSFMIPFSSHPSTQVVALCDMDSEKLAGIANNPEGAELYADYTQMLDQAKPDIVVVATPMPCHADHCIAALERGLHVLGEVPAVVSLDEAKRLLQAVNVSKGQYMMAENCCYTKESVLIENIVKAGLFGTISFAEGEYLHELKALNEITKWRRKWQTGVDGITYGTHSTGPLLQWMGERIVSVSCAGSGHHYTDASGAAYEAQDGCILLGKTASGALVKLRVDMLSNRPSSIFYSLQGTEGCYEAGRGFGDQARIWLRSQSEKIEWMPLADLEGEFLPEKYLDPPREALEAGHGGGDYWQVVDFVDAIVSGRKMPIGIHETMDMTLPGLVSQQSVLQDSSWLPVPDSRVW